MSANIWTASLHIQDGKVAEDAPEIAHAERVDGRGQLANLYILAEPDRPGSEQFIGDLVSRVGEDFLDEQGSLTGGLQRVLIATHENALDWNRTSLPRDQATYGVSCLILRDQDAYLAQIGPSLVYYRQGDRLLRRRPATQRAMPPLGAADVVVPEFSQLTLGPTDWVLLISSGAAAAIGEDTIAALHGLRGPDVLPAIYPMLLRLPRVSALVVALEEETAMPPVAPSDHRQQSDVGHETNADDPADPLTTQIDTAEQSKFPPAVHDARATHRPLSEVITGALSALGDSLRRLTARNDPTDDPEWSTVAEPPHLEIEPDPVDSAAPLETDEGSPVPSADVPIEDDVPSAIPSDVPSDDEFDDSASDEEDPPANDEADNESTRPLDDEGNTPSDDDRPEDPEDPEEPPDSDDPNEPPEHGPRAPASPSESAPSPAASESDSTTTRESVEYQLAPLSPAMPVLGEVSYAASSGGAVTVPAVDMASVEPTWHSGAWPHNPFSHATPPMLDSADEIDTSRLSAPLIHLRNHVPSFRRRAIGRSRSESESSGVTAGWRERWGPIVLGLGAMLIIFAVIGGVLLIPAALEDSERSRIDQAIDEGRRGLTAASLTNDPAASRSELTIAMSVVSRRPSRYARKTSAHSPCAMNWLPRWSRSTRLSSRRT